MRSSLILSALVIAACGRQVDSLVDGGTTGAADAATVVDGPVVPDAEPGCAAAGDGCAAPADCCSGLCDPELLVCLAGECGGGGAACDEAADCCSGTCLGGACRPVPVLPTGDNRDRLLDTLAQVKGHADRCALWAALDNVELGVFLTHSDMLGDRSCLDPGDAVCAAGSDMALDHVFRLWSVNGHDPGCSCDLGENGYLCCNGGGEWHRTFFSADDWLAAALRDDAAGLPEWGPSSDLAGPHDPFDQSSETDQGTPRGQIHFWHDDASAVPLERTGVEGVLDPRMVEIDNDYNLVHDSNPEGCYGVFGIGCTYGRAKYKASWSDLGTGAATTFAGNGQPGPIDELAGDAVFTPRCPAVRVDEVLADGTLRAGAVVRIRGAGFAAGDVVHVRTRAAGVALGGASPFRLATTATELRVQLPPVLGAGEAYVWIAGPEGLSNLTMVTIQP